MTARRVVRLVGTHLLGSLLLAALAVGELTNPGTVADAIAGGVLLGATLVTGWVLAARVPGNAIGWVLMAAAACFVAGPVALLAGDAFRVSAPQIAIWCYWYAGDQDISWYWLPPVWTLLVWLPLHFPDGHLPSRRWRGFQLLTIVEFALALLVFESATPGTHGFAKPVVLPFIAAITEPLLLVSSLLGLVCFGGTVVSLVARYRSGGAAVRAQVRWMAWAVAIAAAGLVCGWLPGSDAYNSWIIALYAAIPISVAIAVLRYRLFEIDRIISRTAAYAIVTVSVVGTYLVVVLLLSAVLRTPGDAAETPPLAVAAATLAAAAVFLPVLRWVRRRVDRVFDRARYDAERVVAAFGQHVRDGSDPHAAGAELLRAVEDSLDPAAVGLWVRP